MFPTSVFTIFVASALSSSVSFAEQPNVIFIVADDLGWNDVGFHGSNQIPTPNIDALAYNGIILNSHYVHSTSTPTRTALLTGKYPMRLGLQGSSFLPADKRSLPDGKLLPEYFKELGYATYLVGKWHLGYSKWNDTPQFKGFDHHFGFYNSFTSYYDYLTTWKFNGKDYTGFDLRNDGKPALSESGKYATDVFTDHTVKTIMEQDPSKPFLIMLAHLAVHAGNDGKLLEAPQEAVDKFGHIVDSNRRTYAAMVSKLDDSLGAIVEALDSKNILQNTVIAFISDNGAPTVAPTFRNWGSNAPLRGVKNTLFEGGIRSVGFVYSPLLVQSARVSTDLIHVTDWLPTLFSAAGGDIGILDPDMDGIDQWSSLVYDLPSPRNDILLNIDEKTRNAALRFYNWKLIIGGVQNETLSGYYGDVVSENNEDQSYNLNGVLESPAGKVANKINYSPLSPDEYELIRSKATINCLDGKAKRNPCDPVGGSYCLYDIPSDPCEENDLAKFFPSVVRQMKRALVNYRSSLTNQLEEETDIDKADPKNFGYVWNPWIECTKPDCSSPLENN
nr:sulf2 [Psylliodes hospes]